MRLKQQKQKTIRASVSFPAEHYEELEKLAQAKKVSVAWMVRDAVENYLDEQWPLFAENKTARR